MSRSEGEVQLWSSSVVMRGHESMAIIIESPIPEMLLSMNTEQQGG